MWDTVHLVMDDVHSLLVRMKGLQNTALLVANPVIPFRIIKAQFISAAFEQRQVQILDRVHFVARHAQSCVDGERGSN